MTTIDQKIEKIAFLGGEHTFSHIAALKYFDFASGRYELLTCSEMEKVVEFVGNGTTDFGLIPFWNTSKYSILTAQEAIIKSPNVRIVDNFKMTINLCLVSQCKEIESIKLIHTIEHVIGQCSQWWHSKKMQDCVITHAKSTIDGLEKALQDSSSAAICSPPAAKRHQSTLNILAEEIQNLNNATLFFLIQREGNEHKKDSKNSTLLAYPLKDHFKTRVDVMKIVMETLTFLTTEWALKFKNGDKWNIVEVDGHPEDLGVKEFIGKVKALLPETRILGVRSRSVNDILEAESDFDSH